MNEYVDEFHRKERAEEERWRLLQEKAFEIAARRDRLLGQWAAARLGLAGAAAADYARSVLETGVIGGADAMIDKVAADLAASGFGREMVAARLDQCAEEAKQMVVPMPPNPGYEK
jgi:hypothetical protein